MDRTAGPQEVSAVEAAFAEGGIPAEVRASIEYKSIEIPPWAIYVTEIGAGAFFTAFSAAAGASAWKHLERLVHSLFESRKNSRAPRGVVIVRREKLPDLLLQHDLPPEAYQALFHELTDAAESGQLRWDPKTRRWRDTFDIARDKG